MNLPRRNSESAVRQEHVGAVARMAFREVRDARGRAAQRVTNADGATLL